jgi:negative regulator of flagellin synthesis FlgM
MQLDAMMEVAPSKMLQAIISKKPARTKDFGFDLIRRAMPADDTSANNKQPFGKLLRTPIEATAEGKAYEQGRNWNRPKGESAMHVYGTTQVHGPQPIGAPHNIRNAQALAPAENTSIQDSVEISDAARLVEQARDIPDIRQDRVDSIRSQIADGTYETEAKLNAAVERLLDEIG